MSIDEFARYSQLLHRLTVDFVHAVPDDRWAFTPDPPGQSGRAPAPQRIGRGFGQWSIYASLAGFDTPQSWRSSWGL